MISEVVGGHHRGDPLPGFIFHTVDGGNNLVVVGDDALDVAEPVVALAITHLRLDTGKVGQPLELLARDLATAAIGLPPIHHVIQKMGC